VDSADGEHEALYHQLQEANQNASNLTYYMNVANQRVMQLEQQVCMCAYVCVCVCVCVYEEDNPCVLQPRHFAAHVSRAQKTAPAHGTICCDTNRQDPGRKSSIVRSFRVKRSLSPLKGCA